MNTDLEKMYEAFYMQVYSYVMTLCNDKELASDITQETFSKALGASEKASFKERSQEYTWLCAIAKNLFSDEMRRRRRFLDEEVIPSEDDFQEKIADSDSSFRIHVILHSLEEPYKEVFELRVFGELSFLKIGEIFGKSENWARVTYHRARLKIRERMDSNE